MNEGTLFLLNNNRISFQVKAEVEEHLADYKKASSVEEKVLPLSSLAYERYLLLFFFFFVIFKVRLCNVLADGCLGEDSSVQLACTAELRKLLSVEQNPPIDEIISQQGDCPLCANTHAAYMFYISLGLIDRLIDFCGGSTGESLKLEAAWALTNIASGWCTLFLVQK